MTRGLNYIELGKDLTETTHLLLLFMIMHTGQKVEITLDDNDTPTGDASNTCTG